MTADPNWEFPFVVFDPYPKGHKVVQLRLARPKGLRQWFRAIWGLDIFIHQVPFLKCIVLLNVVWLWLK